MTDRPQGTDDQTEAPETTGPESRAPASPRGARARVAVALALAVVLAGTAAGFAVASRPVTSRPVTPGAAEPGGVRDDVLAGPGVLARSTADGERGRVVVAGPEGRRVLPLACARVYAAGGTVVCLREESDAPGAYETVVLDRRLRTVWSSPFAGVPSRARVSPGGTLAAWTVFVRGDSYAASGAFSTRAGILDVRTGRAEGTLETFAITLDGDPYRSADVNFWGVTFAAGENGFYATMSTRGRTYLVEGDLSARTVRTLRAGVECPSLSPDGTRVAFKKARPDGTWRPAVLDLATLAELPLAEDRPVDDQLAWRDDRTVMYGLPRPDDRDRSDVWALPADGTGRPRVVVPDADSPAPLP